MFGNILIVDATIHLKYNSVQTLGEFVAQDMICGIHLFSEFLRQNSTPVLC